MKTTFISILLLSLLSVTLAITIPESIRQRVKEAVVVNGCNANVCFAIDGSDAVGPDNFRKSVEFVQAVIGIVGTDRAAEFAATQFGTTTRRIAPLTGLRDNTLKALEDAKLTGGPTSAVASGIIYCDFQLFRRPGEANKLVVITDGKSNFGSNPVTAADKYRGRNPKNSITAVAVGHRQDDVLQRISGQNPVLEVTDYVELALKVDTLVSQICGFNI